MTMAFISGAHAAYDDVCPNKDELLNNVVANDVKADSNKPFDFQATRVDGKGPFKFTAKDFYSMEPGISWGNIHKDSTVVYDPTNTDPYHCVVQIWWKHKMEYTLKVKPAQYTGPKK